MTSVKLPSLAVAIILSGIVLIFTCRVFESGHIMFSYAEENKEEPAKPEGGDDSAKKVYETMSVKRKIDLTTVAKLTKEDILLVDAKTPEDKNTFIRDHLQDVMNALKLPYTLTNHEELETQDLSKAAVMVVNCTEVTLRQKASDNVKKFLESGGYIFTTDWAFDFFLQKVCPGYLKAGNITQAEDHTVQINAFEKSGEHIFLRTVFPEGQTQLPWMFRKGARMFKIEKPNDVTVLVVGPESLKKEAGSNIIAVTWCLDPNAKGYNPKFSGYKDDSGDYLRERPKKGVILHVANHYNQRIDGNPDVDANCSMYQLLVNFLIDARLSKLWREQSKSKKK
ncbi:MAG: hypothetical protein HY811_06365 [Planctomycetes bacterium]|nr:hypothetical protein [Planctomycetota bacterium]